MASAHPCSVLRSLGGGDRKTGGIPPRRAVRFVYGGIVLIAALDYFTPPNINLSIFYAASLAACAWTRSPRHLSMATAMCILLGYAAVVIGEPPLHETPGWLVWANRTLVAGGLLALAGFVHLWMRSAREVEAAHRALQQANETLEHRIAERTRALATSEARYRTYFEHTAESLFVVKVRPHGRFVFGSFNPAYERATGLRSDEVRGKSPDQVLPPAVAASVTANYRRCVEAGEPIRYEETLDLPGGRRHWETILAPVADETGRVTRLLGSARDMTEKRQAEAERDRLFDLSLDLIGIADFSGRTRRVNPACEHFFGRRRGDLAGRPFLDFVHPDDRAPVLAIMEKLKHGETVADHESRWQTADGSYRLLAWTAVSAPNERLIYGMARDVTDQRRAETALRQAQRLEAVGHLTGGVAHDFNNLLTVVLGNLDVIKRMAGENARLHRAAETAERAAERGARLTRQLLAFARRQPLRPEALDIGLLIRDTRDLLRRAVGETITMHVMTAPDLWACRADLGQIEASLLNVVLNARDAMPQGGTITITATNAEIGGKEAAALDIEPGAYVRVAVSDTGTGMTEDVKARCFEPFFTTKPVGKGTGLGLAQLYGFARQSGGTATVDSALGRDTTVALLLPKAEATARDVGRLFRREQHIAVETGPRATVLVVEDEDDVLATTEHALGGLGYRVLTARNGPEALALLSSGEPVDVLFSDIVMPQGVSGIELAREARERWPDLKVLLTTGYAEAATPDEGGGGTVQGFDVLDKPYRQSDLALKLEALIRNPPASLTTN